MERSVGLYRDACRLMSGGVNSPVRAFRAVGGTPRLQDPPGDGEDGSMKEISIYLDAPLAIRVTEVYRKYSHLLNENAKKHFTDLLCDMLGVLDSHLAENEYVAGRYSVADISMYPDVHLHGNVQIGLDAYPNVRRWHDAIAARPQVKKAWEPFAS